MIDLKVDGLSPARRAYVVRLAGVNESGLKTVAYSLAINIPIAVAVAVILAHARAPGDVHGSLYGLARFAVCAYAILLLAYVACEVVIWKSLFASYAPPESALSDERVREVDRVLARLLPMFSISPFWPITRSMGWTVVVTLIIALAADGWPVSAAGLALLEAVAAMVKASQKAMILELVGAMSDYQLGRLEGGGGTVSLPMERLSEE